MKLKVSDLYNLNQGLAELSEKDIPINVSLKVKRTNKKVEEELKSANEIRNDLLNKYKDNESDAGNGKVEIKEDKIQEFNEKYNELMQQEVDIKIDKIKISDLTTIKGFSIKPRTLSLLDAILSDD